MMTFLQFTLMRVKHFCSQEREEHTDNQDEQHSLCMFRSWVLVYDTITTSTSTTTTINHHHHHNNDNNNRIQTRNSRFLTISSMRREPSPTRTLNWPERNRVQITCSTSSAYHVQHVVLRATWYEGTAQLLSLIEFKSHLFELYFVD